ncbi:BufA2 family periplasmic bufferin-type metallophore [Spartinivicinus ruber]|uniref:BufA2 family periplasmic bufferin-type metallophore n=1 Tax=Spartinivicinus ruber TaxID=2683272 RepID=UPI0013D0E988|nr:hypothetical protein [Spartinivicinus ruber]
MKQTKRTLTGVAIAMAAASLISGCAGPSKTSSHSAAPPATGKTDLAHCYGVNICGGHNDCKTANNACNGQAACKGQGFVAMPTKACNDVGGKVKDSWRSKVNKADLVKCYGVNLCKGHNDCKTADNACAGQATCKGQGFVSTTQKSCEDIGGNVG